MNESQEEFCILCGRHCPVDDLHCGKGQQYFENQKPEKIDKDNKNNNIRDYKEDYNMRDERENTNNLENTDNLENTNNAENKDHKEHRGHRHHEMLAFDNQEDDLLALLHKTSHFLHHKRGGKRGQGKLLKILAEHTEISQKNLQELLGIEPGSMSELVIKLEHKGLISRAKDETDKRMTKLMITDLGLELSKEIDASDSEEDKVLMNSLTDEENEQLKALLTKVLKGWEESYGASPMGRRGNRDGSCCGKHHGHHGEHGHHGDHGHHDQIKHHVE
jgi:DNA-binding MarR family transcriptional regulator